MDPNRHQAMMRVPAEGIEENHIVGVMQPGYLMGELVLRPAKVSVAAPLDDGS
jgi:molecular chaperone GrpE